MSLFDIDQSPSPTTRPFIPLSAIDLALTAQFVVAWAGETGLDEKRLGWWSSDLVATYGGMDLFKRLLPETCEWAVLQAAREAARRTDAEQRGKDHDPDRILSLFNFGFEIDERIGERLQDLKRSGQTPWDALPALREATDPPWSRDRLIEWIQSHGDTETTSAPAGRLIKGEPPESLDQLVRRLVGALLPLADGYPLPHYRRTT